MDDEYLNSVNKSSIYRNDIIYADKIFNDVETFDTSIFKDTDGICLIIAQTGSGKSVLTKHLLHDTHKSYDEIYLICKTAKLQPETYNYIPDENILNNYSEAFMTDLWIRKTREKIDGKKTRTLIILDDFIGDKEYEKSNVIKDYAIGSRHLGISLIMLSQNFTSIKPIVRINTRIAIAFALESSKERDKFSETYLNSKNKRVGSILFQKITKEAPYQVIIVEVFRNGASEKEKIKKFIANPMIPKFKVKPIKSEYIGMQIPPKDSQKFKLPECDYTSSY